MQQNSSLYSKQIDENGDYYYTDESSSSSSNSSCSTGSRGFSLSSYSLDSKNSKKIEDFLSSQSSENSFNESFSDYQNRSSYDMQDDENGQLLASYQEMNSKINDLINCNENSKNAASKRPELLEITNKTKNNSRVNDFNNNIHVNTTNEHDNDSSSKSISPKPKFIAPRFEKKWLENQNNSMMNVNHNYNHHYYNNNNQQQSPPPNFIEYSPKCQTFLKQINFNDNFKTTLTSKQNVFKATNSYETNIIKPNVNNNCNNKKTYQKQANQYFKRSSNNLNKTNNNKYLNQKTMSKRSYQCKCLNNNNKCTCYSTVTVNSNNTVQYTNENDFYLNRNIASYNNVNNYNYIQAQNISNTTNTTNNSITTNNNNPNNQNRFRYTAKSRA